MRVLIIDDHPLYREGVKALVLGLLADARVTGVSSVDEARRIPDPDRVDLVLLDMNLPGAHHVDALEQVKSQFDSATVVVVSGEEDPALVFATIDAGAAGYIPKSTEPELTIQALRLVLAQGVYLPPAALSQAGQRKAVAGPSAVLSERQRDVLRCLLQGKANKVIARELGIAEGTVKAHLWSVYQALGVRTRAQAMCKAYELGLLRR